MTRSELIRQIADLNPEMSLSESDAAIAVFFETMAVQLQQHGRIELRGLGTFWVGEPMRGSHVNPRTGQPSDAMSKLRVRFRPSSTLSNRIAQSG
ncbi:HU family DNA-binding protein [Sphingomonas sp. S6]|jgi:integration host factor subunit beta|uniref:HU family DNA-binding protein n=1 Tax=Sphingomonas sp. S6 TaxID=3368600 RepID=UPI000FA966CE|nr:HU family DNA-binding protein [uncultured Sphingomonas sp.]RTL23471.1 MAG: integration host factor subunit beta [Sphingomonadaceae bacterium]